MCFPVGLEPVQLIDEAMVSTIYFLAAGVIGLGVSASVILAGAALLSRLQEMPVAAIAITNKKCNVFMVMGIKMQSQEIKIIKLAMTI
jgi:hypothetical protein